MRYRNHTIERCANNYPFNYSYVHMAYDGPEDGRCGHGDTVQDCRDAIDDAIDDATFCEFCNSTGIVKIENRPFPNSTDSTVETFSEECERCSHMRKSRIVELCSHIRDNQGFCHNCGIPVCEETLRSEGYWKDGMQCEEHSGL